MYFHRLLLLADTDGASAATGGLGVLTTHAQAVVVAHTAVGVDLLQPLEVVTQLGVELRGEQLRELAVSVVLLPVEEPVGHLVLARVRHDRHQLLDLGTAGQGASVASPR